MYEGHSDKNRLLIEENELFIEHESRAPRYDIFSARTRIDWLHNIFSTEELSIPVKPDDGSAYHEDLLLSVKRDFSLSKLYFASAITLMTEYGKNHGMPDEVMETIKRRSFIEISTAKTEEVLEEIILGVSEKCHRLYAENRIESYSYPVSQCIDIIYRNRFDKITLSFLAEQLHMNPSYLSRKFHKETKITLTEYITNVKMEEAREMIRSHLYTLDEIAEMLCFDRRYFLRLLKKHGMMVPAEETEKSDGE